MSTMEAELRRQLRRYAVELRKLAYTFPNGIGEHELLRLSERMNVTADVMSAENPTIRVVVEQSSIAAREA